MLPWFAETPQLDAWGYVGGSLLGALLWLAIFLRRRDLRRRMLWVSLLLLPMAPLGESFFLLDYWNPPLILPIWYGGYEYGGLADFLFAFALGGIATAAYPALTRRAARAGARSRKRWLALAFVVLTVGSVYLLTQLGPVNSIFSSMLGFALTALLVWAVRPDLVRASLVSGLASALTLVSVEAVCSLFAPLFISRYWLLYHSAFGILIAGRVPLTEALWSFAFGAAVGPLYDACVGAATSALDRVGSNGNRPAPTSGAETAAAETADAAAPDGQDGLTPAAPRARAGAPSRAAPAG